MATLSKDAFEKLVYAYLDTMYPGPDGDTVHDVRVSFRTHAHSQDLTLPVFRPDYDAEPSDTLIEKLEAELSELGSAIMGWFRRAPVGCGFAAAQVRRGTVGRSVDEGRFRDALHALCEPGGPLVWDTSGDDGLISLAEDGDRPDDPLIGIVFHLGQLDPADGEWVHEDVVAKAVLLSRADPRFVAAVNVLAARGEVLRHGVSPLLALAKRTPANDPVIAS